MSLDNGPGNLPVDLYNLEVSPRQYSVSWSLPPDESRSRSSLAVAIGLFFATAVTTIAAGAQFASAYAAGHAPALDDFYVGYLRPFTDPHLFLAGVPFACTLLGILLAHELGHFFACRHYHIRATYPFFVPAPTLIGTLGAFIRIRPPITNRRALFDMALAGPLVGFLIAVPALGIAILHSKVLAAGTVAFDPVFGRPLVERLLEAWLRPGIASSRLLLHPVGRAAWVGLFATALNLLPSGQLDGGHILFSVTSQRHRLISVLVSMLLLPLGWFYWTGWFLWAVLLLAVGFRHPPLLDEWEPLDPTRRLWAGFAVAMFLLCFMPAPFAV
jgi:membrane-associated protease RseP (regulator of RpoE activity)